MYLKTLMGPGDSNWRLLEKSFSGKMMYRGSEIHIIGEKPDVDNIKSNSKDENGSRGDH